MAGFYDYRNRIRFVTSFTASGANGVGADAALSKSECNAKDPKNCRYHKTGRFADGKPIAFKAGEYDESEVQGFLTDILAGCGVDGETEVSEDGVGHFKATVEFVDAKDKDSVIKAFKEFGETAGVSVTKTAYSDVDKVATMTFDLPTEVKTRAQDGEDAAAAPEIKEEPVDNDRVRLSVQYTIDPEASDFATDSDETYWLNDPYVKKFKDKLAVDDDYYPTKSYDDIKRSLEQEVSFDVANKGGSSDTAAREIQIAAVLLLIKSGNKDAIRLAHQFGDYLMGRTSEKETVMWQAKAALMFRDLIYLRDEAAKDKVACDAKPNVKTPAEKCNAKNVMTCPYHGAEQMAEAFNAALERGGIKDAMGNVEAVEGKKNTFIAWTVCTKKNADKVKGIINDFLAAAGVKGAKTRVDKDGFAKSTFETDFANKDATGKGDQHTDQTAVKKPDQTAQKQEAAPAQKQDAAAQKPVQQAAQKPVEQTVSKKDEKKAHDYLQKKMGGASPEVQGYYKAAISKLLGEVEAEEQSAAAKAAKGETGAKESENKPDDQGQQAEQKKDAAPQYGSSSGKLLDDAFWASLGLGDEDMKDIGGDDPGDEDDEGDQNADAGAKQDQPKADQKPDEQKTATAAEQKSEIEKAKASGENTASMVNPNATPFTKGVENGGVFVCETFDPKPVMEFEDGWQKTQHDAYAAAGVDNSVYTVGKGRAKAEFDAYEKASKDYLNAAAAVAASVTQIKKLAINGGTTGHNLDAAYASFNERKSAYETARASLKAAGNSLAQVVKPIIEANGAPKFTLTNPASKMYGTKSMFETANPLSKVKVAKTTPKGGKDGAVGEAAKTVEPNVAQKEQGNAATAVHDHPKSE